MSRAVRAFALTQKQHKSRARVKINWKFTADDLTALLHRISQPEQTASQQAALSQAA